MKKDLIIIRGIPGSGKNTFAELLGPAICTADDYFMDINGNYNFRREGLGRAHAWCQRKCELFMKRCITPTIVANTSTTEKELKPYILMAEKYGYRVFSVIVENRHFGKNLHDVPEVSLNQMKERFSIKL